MITREQILNEPAGRKMDALVARLVFEQYVEDLWYDGQYPCESGVGEYNPITRNRHSSDIIQDVPSYSTDISEAFKVVEKLKEDPLAGRIHLQEYKAIDGNWYWDCSIYTDGRCILEYNQGTETAPLAICRAALLTTLKL